MPITQTVLLRIDAANVRWVEAVVNDAAGPLQNDGSGNLVFSNHLNGGPAQALSVVVGPAAGTGATATVSGNDLAFQVVLNTGNPTPAGGGVLFTVTFAHPFSTAPKFAIGQCDVGSAVNSGGCMRPPPKTQWWQMRCLGFPASRHPRPAPGILSRRNKEKIKCLSNRQLKCAGEIPRPA